MVGTPYVRGTLHTRRETEQRFIFSRGRFFGGTPRHFATLNVS
jgi:hypothetical protein